MLPNNKPQVVDSKILTLVKKTSCIQSQHRAYQMLSIENQ